MEWWYINLRLNHGKSMLETINLNINIGISFTFSPFFV